MAYGDARGPSHRCPWPQRRLIALCTRRTGSHAPPAARNREAIATERGGKIGCGGNDMHLWTLCPAAQRYAQLRSDAQHHNPRHTGKNACLRWRRQKRAPRCRRSRPPSAASCYAAPPSTTCRWQPPRTACRAPLLSADAAGRRRRTGTLRMRHGAVSPHGCRRPARL